jgi:hypothetical protein
LKLQTVGRIFPEIFTGESVLEHIRALLETLSSRKGAWLLRITLLGEKRLIFFHVLQRSGQVIVLLTRIIASEYRSTLSTCRSTVRAAMGDAWGTAALLVKASSVLECG